MRQRIAAAIILALALPAVLAAVPGGAAETSAADDCAGVLCAGAASVDATWHVGGGQGQLGTTGHSTTTDRFDPYHHSTKMAPSDGVQSRTFAKAIMVQGPDGTLVAYVKTDVYLQQDILTRRVAQLVTGGDPTATEFAVEGLQPGNVMLGGTHNHSVPHYTSTAWGVWAFADVFDARAFDHMARRIAQAIKDASVQLRPARVGASVTRFADVQQNILGRAVADDGSPAGFPRDHFDRELAVIRFDEAADGHEPIAALVNFAMHPESIGGSADLISSDFTGVVEREVERALGRHPGAEHGPVVAWSQGGLGDVEPDSGGRATPPEAGREYWRRDYAQAERMSLRLAAAVLDTWHDVAAGTPDVPHKFVPLSTDAAVDMRSHRFAGPPGHPVPTVSNCRTEWPGAPVIGLPDCTRGGAPPAPYQVLIDGLRDAGVPVPENYGAPAYTGVHEGLTIHLQVLRIGEILLGTCPCEPVTDMALNFKTRADRQDDNLHNGFEYPCREGGQTGVECDFREAAWRPADWRPVDADAHARMRAQVRNDAAGWDDDPGTFFGEAEPTDPADIRGNFTHTELAAGDGFTLPLLVGTANDYVGYVVTYREFQRGDHYRKALTAFGPHTADYINSRLVEMAGQLRGGPAPKHALAPLATADDAANDARAQVVGSGAHGATTAYDAALPDDGGTPGAPVTQPPASLERFGAATFTWEGGSNYTDNPHVVVQRRDGDGTWRTVATQEGGEVVVTIAYDSWRGGAPVSWASGSQPYRWTATWEVFERTEPGTYRFAVAGHHRSSGAPVPYETQSDAFEVAVWSGLEVVDLQVDGATVTFAVTGAQPAPETRVGPRDLGPGEVRYPHTYAGGHRFVREQYHGAADAAWRFCFRCTFRAWAFTGAVAEALVTVHTATGDARTVAAVLDPTTNRFVANGLDLGAGDTVSVHVTDLHGNTNR